MSSKGVLPPAGEVEQIDAVEETFRQWDLYAKLEAHNYLHHREVYALVSQFLRRLSQPFTLLDLGCGDAGSMVKALEETSISHYVGIDLSPMALALAAKNLAALKCPHLLGEKDYCQFVSEADIRAEVIWMGLTFHHLPQPQKAKFLGCARQILPDGGFLLMYEPTLLEDEDREQFLERWWRTCQGLWEAMSPAEMEQLHQHVVNHDFPEKLSVLEQMGRQQGFSGLSRLYQDPEQICTLICLPA